ncbi:MAG: hypothetical protein R3200_12600 [Xanthomonadales bacterium]|nr:hypothetical protein [Xanthomonadales bacterium]
MYNPKRLATIAWDGLDDLIPALREAYFESDSRRHLASVYGSNPMLRIALMTVAAALLGEWFARFGPEFPFKDQIRWSAALVAATFALLIRRYLFRSPEADDGDFAWLAASLLPPFVGVLIISQVADLVAGTATSDNGWYTSSTTLGQALIWATDELGIAAALTIGVATLCYSRDWLHALFDLVVRLAVFKLMVWITVLVTIEIGIIGRIVGAILEAVFGITFPEWMQQLADDLSYAALISVIYLAIIGGTWTICRDRFAELLKTGHVDILSGLNEALRPEEKDDLEDDTLTPSDGSTDETRRKEPNQTQSG